MEWSSIGAWAGPIAGLLSAAAAIFSAIAAWKAASAASKANATAQRALQESLLQSRLHLWRVTGVYVREIQRQTSFTDADVSKGEELALRWKSAFPSGEARDVESALSSAPGELKEAFQKRATAEDAVQRSFSMHAENQVAQAALAGANEAIERAKSGLNEVWARTVHLVGRD